MVVNHLPVTHNPKLQLYQLNVKDYIAATVEPMPFVLDSFLQAEPQVPCYGLS